MRYKFYNTSTFFLVSPILFGCGNAVDNKRKAQTPTEKVITKSEIPFDQIKEFENKINNLVNENMILNSKILELTNQLYNTDKDFKDYNKLLISSLKTKLINKFNILGDNKFNETIKYLNNLESNKSLNEINFDELFNLISSYLDYYFENLYKNRIHKELTPQLNKLIYGDDSKENYNNITQKIVSGKANEIFEEINRRISSSSEEEKNKLYNDFAKILKNINIDNFTIYSNDNTIEYIVNDLKNNANIIQLINEKIAIIVDQIKRNSKTEILNKLGIPTEKHETFTIENFKKDIISELENEFSNNMKMYLIQKNIIKDYKDKSKYIKNEYKLLQDAVYDPKIKNYNSLYKVIIDNLLLILENKNKALSNLEIQLRKNNNEIELLKNKTSIFNTLKPFPNFTMDCSKDLNLSSGRSLEYLPFNDRSSIYNFPYLIEISSIESTEITNYQMSRNKINKCLNNKKDNSDNNSILNIEFFKYNSQLFNDAFIIHIEDKVKSLYSFHFPNKIKYLNRYSPQLLSGFSDGITRTRYTIIDAPKETKLNNDLINEMHAIIFSRYFSDQLTHGHSSVSNKYSLINNDENYEFWLVDNNAKSKFNILNSDDELISKDKYLKIELNKYTDIISGNIYMNACFYSRKDDKLVEKCFNENFGENINIRREIIVKNK